MSKLDVAIKLFSCALILSPVIKETLHHITAIWIYTTQQSTHKLLISTNQGHLQNLEAFSQSVADDFPSILTVYDVIGLCNRESL